MEWRILAVYAYVCVPKAKINILGDLLCVQLVSLTDYDKPN